jgi:hypothetical protein
MTGSVFEANEGTGEEPLRAFSGYGLSKTLTWSIAEFSATTVRSKIGKFVIANPFGPFEEERFTTYLIRSWCNGATAEVKTPSYVRDNIHVSLLALAYKRFVERFCSTGIGSARSNPSCYVETQGSFTHRFASAMRFRLNLPCEFALAEQKDFSEPIVRINTERIFNSFPEWNEESAWDELAEYYEQEYKN